jgi:hypothetical protein
MGLFDETVLLLLLLLGSFLSLYFGLNLFRSIKNKISDVE